MNKIIDYIVIDGGSTFTVARRVQDHLEIGWQPMGGMQMVTYGHNTLHYYQTMVKYEEPVVVGMQISDVFAEAGNCLEGEVSHE